MRALEGLEPSSLDSKGGLDEPLLDEMVSPANPTGGANVGTQNPIVLTKILPPPVRFDEPKINFDPIPVFDLHQDCGIFGI